MTRAGTIFWVHLNFFCLWDMPMKLAINICWLVQKYTSAQLYYINILGSKDPISLIKRNNASCQQVRKGHQQGLRRRWRADSWGKVRNPQPYYVALKQMAGLRCAGQRSTKEGSSTYLLRQASRQAFLVLQIQWTHCRRSNSSWHFSTGIQRNETKADHYHQVRVLFEAILVSHRRMHWSLLEIV